MIVLVPSRARVHAPVGGRRALADSEAMNGCLRTPVAGGARLTAAALPEPCMHAWQVHSPGGRAYVRSAGVMMLLPWAACLGLSGSRGDAPAC